MMERLRLQLLRRRFVLVVGAHVALFILAYYLAYVIVLDGALSLRRVHGREAWASEDYWPTFVWSLPWLLVIRLICFSRFDLFRGLWRYVSISDLAGILLATTIGTVVFSLVAVVSTRSFLRPPFSVIAVEWLMCIVLTGGVRFALRIFRETLVPVVSSTGVRTCILGAGDAGEMLLREMRTHRHRGYWPVCFVDDDETKQRRKIHGLPVAGTVEDLPHVVASYGIAEIVIAITTASGEQMQRIVDKCDETGVRYRVVPSEGDIVRLTQIREVNIEDLLGRPPAVLDIDRIRADVSAGAVLITGAAGSIGSELVRQCASYGPPSLTLIDRNENGLFYLEREILEGFPGIPLNVVVGDILDDATVARAFAIAPPKYVFHAAAFKHVPLMEANPEEAVKNNVLGSRKLALASREAEVDKFVLISTDKAVRPTSVMGATKRAAELFCQAFDPGETQFISVRFGNVLGSEGSIVPLFRRQIRAGGPVTVTDPAAVRYFMTIPEAVQLVLQAGTMGEGGEIFLLEMGRPVKIIDVAHNLIRLSGLIPGEDIAIKFIGLRPGEKLYEELLTDGEDILPTAHDQIRVQRGVPPVDGIVEAIDGLIESARNGDRGDVIRRLGAIVPEYAPNNPDHRAALEGGGEAT
jgi:FlaA1/EpsC-like NDP-sugar epimerase